MSMVKIEFIDGPFKSLLVPESWLRADETMDFGGWLTKFAPPVNVSNTFLGIFDRGISISDSSASTFAKLLSERENLKDARALQPAEIKELAKVMGANSVGDNQFTNPCRYPDAKSPVFALEYARLVEVNERMVLEVQGKFLDQQGAPVNFYRGIFVPSKSDPNKIQEFFLQTNSGKEFVETQNTYQNSIQSIEW